MEGDGGARCSARHDHGPTSLIQIYDMYLFARTMNKHAKPSLMLFEAPVRNQIKDGSRRMDG